jgi:DNA ligase-1
MAGAGSQELRASGVRDLFARLTADEQHWLRGVMTGNVRQGALDALVQEAIATASGVRLTAVRRAAMLAGGTVPIVVAAMTGGEAALAEIGLEVGRPILPMLASTAPDVAAAIVKAGGKAGAPVVVDTKLDGIRIQVHRHGDEITVATRSLDDITERLPEVVAVVRALPGGDLVLDGEAIALDESGRPRPFQETASRTAQAPGEPSGDSGVASVPHVTVTPYFFDVLHAAGRDLLDAPSSDRLEVLDALVPEANRVPRLVTDDPAAAGAFVQEALARGHEGVVVKSLSIGYAAGRRGSGWVKVKPVHTLDLVVLAVEWGNGRRQGWLSNIHLGARDPAANDGAGGFVMLGKTFKGMTDQMLRWQTERFTELAVEPETVRDHYVVALRPEQVVEIAFDGLQRSTRYPGGLALRFARVVRYRDDKSADEADTIESVRALADR